MSPLVLDRCTLRPWAPDDVPALVRHADNRVVWLNLRDSFPHPYTPADARSWIAYTTSTYPLHHLAIEVSGEAVGSIGLMPLDDVNAITAEVGYWLGEAVWGRGIATDALRGFVPYSFAHFPVHRLEAGVFEWNQASARVLEKTGFTFEGRLRRRVLKDGRIGDQLLYALVR